MTEKKFVKGVNAFKPRVDFVKAELVITVNDLVQFCKENPELLTDYKGNKQLKVQIKEGKEGKWYAEVNQYKPKEGGDLPF